MSTFYIDWNRDTSNDINNEKTAPVVKPERLYAYKDPSQVVNLYGWSELTDVYYAWTNLGDEISTVYTKNTLTPNAGDYIYNANGEVIEDMIVDSCTNQTLTIKKIITITTPYETIKMPEGSTLAGKLSKLPGDNVALYHYLTSFDDTESAAKRYLKLDRYVYGNQVVDINNMVFNSDARIEALVNIPTLSSFEITGSITTWTEDHSVSDITIIYHYKGVEGNAGKVNVCYDYTVMSGVAYNIYSGNISCGSGTTANLTKTDSIYVNNTLYFVKTNTSTSSTNNWNSEANEYNSFPSSGTLRWVREYSPVDAVSTLGYTWMATARSSLNADGYGWDWTLVPTGQE